jgi:hypothetical protein
LNPCFFLNHEKNYPYIIIPNHKPVFGIAVNLNESANSQTFTESSKAGFDPSKTVTLKESVQVEFKISD